MPLGILLGLVLDSSLGKFYAQLHPQMQATAHPSL